MTIAVDFDGTIVTHKYPNIGEELPFATETLKMLINEGHRVILWSVRTGKLLDDAVEWCRRRGVEFYAVNKDFPEENETENQDYARKIRVDVFIDDRNLGGIPDWGTIYTMINEGKTYQQMLSEAFNSRSLDTQKAPKTGNRKWWQF